MTRRQLVILSLRLGLIFVFSYVPSASYLDPSSYYHYLPAWSAPFINKDLALTLLSIFELLLVGWFIWGKQLLIPSILAAVALTGILILNFPSFGVIFRNVSIIFSAIALAILSTE